MLFRSDRLPRLSPQNRHCVHFVSLCRSDAITRRDQVRNIGRGVVRRDAFILVPEQHLTIFEGDTCSSESPAKRVLQIVHP